MAEALTSSGAAPPLDGAAPTAPSGDRGPRLGSGFIVGLLLAFVAVVALGAGLRALQAPGGGDDGWHGTVYDVPTARPDFTLTDTDGQPFDFAAETSGELTLLFFGYTSCPDVCPITLGTLQGALDGLDGVAADVVFVSVDPQRDTADELGGWLEQFGGDNVGLRGDAAAVDDALATVDLPPPTFGEPDDDGWYSVGHSSRVFLIGSDDQVHVVYPFGVRQNEWAADLQRAVDEGWA